MSDFPLFDERPKIRSVGELTREIQTLLEDGFPSVWVVGEIAEVKKHRSGHWYLTLKDAQAQLRAVVWRSAALRLRFAPQNGLQVLAHGRLSVYAPHGGYQLQIDTLEPRGAGAHDLALRQLRQKLTQLGYFAAERKRPLPRFPSRIALVTSPSGAAIRDMLEILGRRWPIAQVFVCPVRVQGEGATETICAALRRVNRCNVAEVLILGRGGGSGDDLAAFNDENVARAIFESRIPVVSAVGHEINVTLADLVADRRALTPSEAAELATPDRTKLLEGVRSCDARLRDLLLRHYGTAAQRVAELAARKPLRLPLDRIHDQERRLDEIGSRLDRAIRQRRDRGQHQLDFFTARLEALSPLNVLARGYSLTRKEYDQSVVRSVTQVEAGMGLVTVLYDGQVVSRVESRQASPPRPAED